MRNLILFFAVLVSHSFMHAQVTTKPVNSVQTTAESIMQNESMQQAAFSFYAIDMTTSTIIADYNGQMSLPSASTMKLITTATATQYLGRGYHFKTQLMYSGKLDTLTGVLDGDVYIIGGGDPTLGSKYYNKEGHQNDFLYEWASILKEKGIKEIKGRVIGDGSKYDYNGVPAGWVWGDMGNYYGAGPSGLTIYDNMCKLEFETGPNAGDSTKLICINPYVPGLVVQNQVKSANGNSDDAYVFGAPYSLDWFVQGTIPKNQESFEVKASIPDPEYLAAIEFDYALNQTGIKTGFAPTTFRALNKNIPFQKPTLTLIHEHSSPSLASIMDEVNQKSINLFAEHVLCEISYKKSGYGSTYDGAQYCMSYWKSKIGAGLYMTDGSGLSRSNAVSAKFFVNLLTYMHKSESGEKFKSSLALAGKRGTMAGMCNGTTASGRVYGKSGTMNRIKSYAGYVDSSSGKKIAYAMIFNNHECSTSQIKKYCESIMVKMSTF